MTDRTDGPEPRHRPVLDALGTPQPTQEWKELADLAYRAAWPLLQNREDCLEAAQEAMAALWGMPGPPPRDLHAWVRVVARNKAYDIITAARRTRRTRDRLAEMASSSCPNPMDDVDDQLHVMALLADLPSGERLACLLCWYAGMSRREVAEHMGVSDETVKTWLKRARRRMRIGDQTRGDDT